jgi:hypothetical protein
MPDVTSMECASYFPGEVLEITFLNSEALSSDWNLNIHVGFDQAYSSWKYHAKGGSDCGFLTLLVSVCVKTQY